MALSSHFAFVRREKSVRSTQGHGRVPVMPLAMVVLDKRKLARSRLEMAPSEFGPEPGQLSRPRLTALADLPPSHLEFG